MRVTLALMLVMVAVLLAAGCAGQPSTISIPMNATVPIPATLTIITPSAIPAIKQIQNNSDEFSGYWIKIDAISDKPVGGVFTTTSTTNLSAGDEILVQVYSDTWQPGGRWRTGEFSGSVGNVKVMPGRNGNNTISFTVNTSGYNPDVYVVTKSAIAKNVTGTARFVVIPERGSSK